MSTQSKSPPHCIAQGTSQYSICHPHLGPSQVSQTDILGIRQSQLHTALWAILDCHQHLQLRGLNSQVKLSHQYCNCAASIKGRPAAADRQRSGFELHADMAVLTGLGVKLQTAKKVVADNKGLLLEIAHTWSSAPKCDAHATWVRVSILRRIHCHTSVHSGSPW